MHWGNMSGMGIGGFGFGWIFMMLFWGFAILGVIYIFKGLLDSRETVVNCESAGHILKKRYASGELSKD